MITLQCGDFSAKYPVHPPLVCTFLLSLSPGKMVKFISFLVCVFHIIDTFFQCCSSSTKNGWYLVWKKQSHYVWSVYHFSPRKHNIKLRGDTYILASQIALHWCQHCRARVRDTYELGKVAVKYCFQIFWIIY